MQASAAESEHKQMSQAAQRLTSAGQDLVLVDLASLVVGLGSSLQDGSGRHTVGGEATLGDGLACIHMA